MKPALLSSVTIAVVVFQCAEGFAERKADSQAAALFERAEKLFKAKKYDEAISVVSRGIAIAPRNPKGYVIRGRIRSRRTSTGIEYVAASGIQNGDQRLSKGDSSSVRLALNDFRHAIKLGDRGIDAHIGIGACQLKLLAVDQALASYTKAIEINAKSVDALSGRAMCHLFKKSYHSAIADLSRVLKLQPENTAALNHRAVCWVFTQKPDAAYADFSKWIKLDPRNSAPWLGRGTLQALRARAEGKSELLAPAIRDIEKAIELSPKNVAAHYSLAAAYEESRQPGEAIAVLTRGLRIVEDRARLFRERAKIHFRAGNRKAAAADADMAVKLASTVNQKATCYKERGDIYLLLGNKEQSRSDAARGRWYSELAKLNMKLVRNPRDQQSRLARAKHFHDNGQSKEALADYAVALKSDAKSAEAFTGRAEIWLAIGKPSKALADCNVALKINPRNREAVSTRADAFLATGDYSKAIADYERINAFGGNFARAYWLRANAHKKAGRLRQAEADYRRAAAMDPSLKRN